MTEPTPKTLLLVLTDDLTSGRIVVDLESFLQFNFDMDRCLGNLEQRWVHAAAPSAGRVWRQAFGRTGGPRKPR